MTMIERVARAICKARYNNGGDESDDGFDSAPPKLKQQYLSEARAAIEAMREPTEQMILAGEDIDAVAPRWACMINEALSEK